MIEVDRWIIDHQAPARLVMQVHDELVLEVDHAALETVKSAVVACMRDAAELKVALEVDVGTGSDWESAH
jgi:DNA polymerase I